MKKKITIILYLLLLAPLSILAQNKQDTTTNKLTVVVETKDGSRFVGKFIERRNDTVVLQTKTMGLILLAESQIKSIDEVGKAQEGSSNPTWFRNPYASQGLFLPTGIGLKKGEGNYQNLMVGLNSVQYGITDNFSVAGGLEIISLFTTGTPGVIYFQPKLSYSFTKNFHVSGGGYLFVSGFDNSGNFLFLPFASLTFGNRDNNFSVGTYVSTQGGALFLISGQVRVAQKFSLVGDIYVAGGGASFTLGGRFMTETFGLNFGLFRPFGSSSITGFFTIPYVGVIVPFGNKNK
jgi:hypothetical protein